MELLHFASDQNVGTTIVTCEKYARPERAVCRMEDPSVNMD